MAGDLEEFFFSGADLLAVDFVDDFFIELVDLEDDRFLVVGKGDLFDFHFIASAVGAAAPDAGVAGDDIGLFVGGFPGIDGFEEFRLKDDSLGSDSRISTTEGQQKWRKITLF